MTTLPDTRSIKSTTPQAQPDAPTFTCDICGKPAAGNTAMIYARYREFYDYPKQVRAWEERHADELAQFGQTLSIWIDHPDQARWRVVHDHCVDDIERESANTYWFEVSRADSWHKLIEWTAHLMGKRWFAWTDWERFLERLGAYRAGA
jgi:hypothetical protein